MIQAVRQAKSGDYVAAVAEVEQWISKGEIASSTSYAAACVYSLASAAAARDERLSEDQRDERRDRYSSLAVDLLDRSRVDGYFDSPDRLRHFSRDPDLDPLREQAEFQSFLQRLQQP